MVRTARFAGCIPFALSLLLATGCSDGDEDATTSGDERTTIDPEATSTTADPTVGALCETLADAPYEVRKAALRDAGDLVVEAPCSELVDALEAAVDLEERASQVDGTAFSIDLRCNSTTITATYTNQTHEVLGIAGSLRRHAPGDPDDPARVAVPFVVWSVEPGASTEVQLEVNGSAPGCGANGQAFLADDTPVDASIPGEVAQGDQSSLDPAVWFPALIEAEQAWHTAGDRNGVAGTEDLRSGDYRGLVASATEEPVPADELSSGNMICQVVEGPGRDLVAIAYQRQRPTTGPDGASIDSRAATETRFGAFRRGADGRWRWLLSSVPLEADGC